MFLCEMLINNGRFRLWSVCRCLNSIRLCFSVLVKLKFGFSNSCLWLILVVMQVFICFCRNVLIFVIIFWQVGVFCMVCGFLCMCMRQIVRLLFIVVFSVLLCCSEWMLLIRFVLRCVVLCMIVGVEVFIEIMMFNLWVMCLIIGVICFSFFVGEMLCVLGWVDLLLMLMSVVFFCIMCLVCCRVLFSWL